MVSRNELESRYEEYKRSIEETNIVIRGEEPVNLPTKEAAQNEDFNVELRNTSINGSHKLLLANDPRRAGVQYLSPDLLAFLSVKLTDVLKANVCDDHEEYWWFTHEFINNMERDLFPNDLISNLELLIRLVLASPSMSTEDKNHSKIIREAKTLSSYIGYPTLEGFIKIACRRDIKMNGEIREGRKIRELGDPNKRNYTYYDEGEGKCSNLGMLLWHYETEIACPRNQVLFEKMRDEIGDLFDHPPDLVYGLLSDFRNDSLHGQNQASREYGVLVNYICLIIWSILY